MSKILSTVNEFKTLSEAMKVAEGYFQQTRGMFACFEGEVWISKLDGSIKTEYNVWIIGGDYIPSWEELYESCSWVELPRLYTPNIKPIKALTKMGKLKWKRYS